MNYFRLCFVFTLVYLPAVAPQSFAIPVNFTTGEGPTPRQYHSGLIFQAWNQTDMDNTCDGLSCGPFCNTSASTCTVPVGYDPVYASKTFPTSQSDLHLTSLNCSSECCSDEVCYRAVNKNGDNVTIPGEEVVLIFGGKVLNSLSNYPECYWNFPLTLCPESLSNDLWFFYVSQRKWSLINPGTNPSNDSSQPSPRFGHQAVLVDLKIADSSNSSIKVRRKFMYIYGGLSQDGAFDDMWVYEIPWAAQRYYPAPGNGSFWNRGNHWRRITFGVGPGKRAFHSMTVDPNSYECIYLFGGVDQNGTDFSYSNDLWRFWIGNETWEKLTMCGISAIQREVKLWDGNSMLYSVGIYDDIYSSDIISYATVDSKTFWNCYAGSVNIPGCRAYANLNMDLNGNLYIFGGYNGSKTYLNDFWIINLKGTDCSFECNPNIYIESLDTLVYQTLEYPNSASSASSSYLQSLDALIQYGGFNTSGTKGDLWLWFRQSALWHSYSDKIGTFNNTETGDSVDAPTLKGHVVLPLNQGLIIHGGITFESVPVDSVAYVNGFDTNCSAFQLYQLSKDNIYSINQSIYREMAFLKTSGSPCFKESPSLTTYPDAFYPLYSTNLYIFDPCNQTSDTTHGECYLGHYYCTEGYYGDQCQNTMCPNSFCVQDNESFISPFCEFCSKHGDCRNGQCVCYDGYTGENCSIVDCQNNCSDSAGVCMTQFVQNQCRCDISKKRGFDDCSIIFCLNNCSNNGACISGVCSCQNGFSGTDCSVYNISLLVFAERVRFIGFLGIFLLGLLIN